MKMNALFNFIISVHFLCFKGQTQHVGLRPRCGFPGLPFRGNITPYKDEYDINERILYKCQDGYDLEGTSYNDCNGNAIWDIQRPPLCRQNFAYRCKTIDSASYKKFASDSAIDDTKFPSDSAIDDTKFPSDSAIDGNPTTCTNIKDGTNGSRWWTVYFQKRINMSEIKVLARSDDSHYNLTLSIGFYLTYQCNKIVFTEKTSGENLNRTVRCEGQAFILLIEDSRPSWMRTLNLCEVAVYSEIDLTCGEPDRNPNCLTANVSVPNVQRVNYYPKRGYSIAKGKEIRTCSQGKWLPTISPRCERDNSTGSNFTLLPVIALVILLCVTAIVCNNYKSEISYYLFSKGICLKFVSEEDVDADKEYDAFVSYSGEDEDWVVDFLVPGLEQGIPSYKLCLHNRDWLAGEFITDQIVRSVQSSRRTILVLTDNYLNSQWSRLEFDIAYQQGLKDKVRRVIAIVPNEVPDLSKIDQEFKTFITLTTYVEAKKPYFWTKLRASMPRTLSMYHQQRDNQVI